MSQGSFEHKIAQMVLIGFRGQTIEKGSPIYRDIVERGIGGVVLFDRDVPTQTSGRNIQSPEQLVTLTTRLQSLSKEPLFIAIDQEGGQVARLKPEYGFPETVSHQWLGEQNCLAVTRRHAAEMAKTLAAAGINLNFAPCVDLNLNPQNPIIAAKGRSFSHDPNIVVGQAIEFIKAFHAQGVRCAIKHFPGHGSSKDDSHRGFVDITDSWWPDELLPYEKLIKLGLVDVIMTAHVFHAKLDDAYPATLSYNIITKKLREELGYDGLVFSDDLQMNAITAHYGLEMAVEQAIHAGVDVLLFGNNSVYDEMIAAKVIERITQLVETGKISPDRIEASLKRIQLLKSKIRRAQHE